MSGGSAMTLIPLLKKLGFLSPDGSPTDAYNKFREDNQSGSVLAGAMKLAYEELFKRNEYAHKLPKEKLIGQIVEITGQPKDSSMVRQIVGTFETIKKYADFEIAQYASNQPLALPRKQEPPSGGRDEGGSQDSTPNPHAGLGLNLGYTINLNLPPTSDIAVFDAIFSSLKENLLRS